MVPALVAFLRAINVGGHNVKMDHLRSLVSGYGLIAVESFIASGNLIFDGGRRKPAAIETMLETKLEADLGYPVATFVRTTAEVADVVTAQPFSAATGRYYVTFLKQTPTIEASERLAGLCSEAEQLLFLGRELHWLVREGFETRLTDAQFARVGAGPGTSRNITTVRKLALKYALAPHRLHKS